MHGENATYIAKTFYKTLAVVKYIGGSNGLPGELHTLCPLSPKRCQDSLWRTEDHLGGVVQVM